MAIDMLHIQHRPVSKFNENYIYDNWLNQEILWKVGLLNNILHLTIPQCHAEILTMLGSFLNYVFFLVLFFFLEQRRRTARHFIKVEKELQRSKWPNTHTPLPRTRLLTRHTKRKKRTTKLLQALSSRRQQPENQLLEFGGPGRAPEPTLRANSPKDFLNTWPLIIKDTRIAMLPNLPSHQNYQGVEAFTQILRDSRSCSLPPPWETNHSRLWCQL